MENQPVLLTKIHPPQTSARALDRPRVMAALMEALHHRVTVVQAGAGYGKSIAVMSLVDAHHPLIWYQITRDDNDPFVFLQHLLHATQIAIPELQGLPISTLESWDSASEPFPTRDVLYRYLNTLNNGLEKPTLLILEDIHLASHVPEINQILDQLINLAPHHLHTILTTRYPLDLPSISGWMARGQLLQIDQELLAFTPEEISSFFRDRYNHELSAEDIEFLMDTTEGWAITLQMVGQSLGHKGVNQVRQALNFPSARLDSLFEILAKEVLSQQPPPVRKFMQTTSVLQVMIPEVCDALSGIEDSKSMLEKLHREDMFVYKLSEHQYRYHHIFHAFLRGQLDTETSNTLHRKATSYFREYGDLDSAFYHAIKARDDLTAAAILSDYGEELLRKGRYNTLNKMLDSLVPEALQKYPTLLFLLGELARLHSRFQEALGWYQQAEVLWREQGQVDGTSRALRGQARVYLDTVNPSKAEELLQQSLRLSDGTADRDTMARLYELVAENKLNAGKGEEAEVYRRQAEELRREGPTDSQLMIRVLLRTGQLAQARQQIEQLVEIERTEPVQQPRGHRETLLLLSIICAMQGEAQEAYEAAIEGTRRGEELESPFVTAVGHIRQGHALMMLSKTRRNQQAIDKFNHAIELSRTLRIPRLRIEAYWGLARAYGYRGELEEAGRLATKGIEMASSVGDEWIASLIRSTMGAGHILADDHLKGHEWLSQAMHGFQACSDPFGLTSARLWRCLSWFYTGEEDKFADSFKLVLESSLRHDYESLLTNPTLLGVPDIRRIIPLLLEARKKGWAESYPDRLLHTIGLGQLELHPGYQLKITTLGSFKVWWGSDPIPTTEWKREKARQLLQVMIAHRMAPLDRDQICEYLWPGLDTTTSHRNFKVALSTLYHVLEPDRTPSSESAYIIREGSTYALRPTADVWLDADTMDAAIEEADLLYQTEPSRARDRLMEVLDLYQGEFLPDARYETWAAAERERLTVQFLRSCDHLCEWSLESDPEMVISICQRVITVDNCWERAYRFMMKAYARLGDHGQVARTFQACLDALHVELDVAPASQTFELYRSLLQNSKIDQE